MSTNTTYIHIKNFIFKKILIINTDSVQKKAEALIVSSKEIGLEVNVDKTKYRVMSRDQNAGRSHIMET